MPQGVLNNLDFKNGAIRLSPQKTSSKNKELILRKNGGSWLEWGSMRAANTQLKLRLGGVNGLVA
jgi:hypothetical protein